MRRLLPLNLPSVARAGPCASSPLEGEIYRSRDGEGAAPSAARVG
jgi:hypothetical protein